MALIAISTALNIVGILTYANAKINEIKVDTEEKIASYNIHVPQNQISSIVKSFWLDKVVIEAKSSSTGLITLQTIKKAA